MVDRIGENTMEVSFVGILYYSGYFITGRLFYFGDDKHTNFSYNIYLQVHQRAVQTTNTHVQNTAIHT